MLIQDLNLKEWDVILIPHLEAVGESPAVLINFQTGVNAGKGLKIVGVNLFEYKKQDLELLTHYASFRSISSLLSSNSFYFFKKIGFYKNVGEKMVFEKT